MRCDFIACPVNRGGVCRVDLVMGKSIEGQISPSCPQDYKSSAEGVVFDNKVSPFRDRIFGEAPVKPYDPSLGGSGDHGGV